MRRLLLAAIAIAPLAATAQTNPYGTKDMPFALLSPWNIGMGSGAQWGNPSDPDVSALRNLNAGINGAVWGQPIYFGSAADPVMTVTNSDAVLPTPPQTVRIPAHAQPASGTDRHMTFFDATQPERMWSYWGCNIGGGQVNCALGGVWDITSDGIEGVAGRGDYNFAIGTITNYDISQGRIAHAVRFALSADVSRAPGPTWTSNIPWPNTHIDYYGPQLYTGNIIAGGTIGIPATTDLSRLGLSPGGMMLAQALQNYGGIWRDSCGARMICFYTTPEHDNHPLIQQARQDLAKIVPQLSILRNQGPDTVNGGGSYLRAEAAANTYYPATLLPVAAAPFTEQDRAALKATLAQAPAGLPVGPTASQLADIQNAIARLQAQLATQLTRATPMVVVTPGAGQALDQAGHSFAVTPSGSVTMNGAYVPGGGDTQAVATVDGVIWGQDARNQKWFTWDGWWTEQEHAP